MSKKKRTSAKITDSETAGNEATIEEPQTDAEPSTPEQETERPGEEAVEAGQPSGNMSEEAEVADVTKAEGESGEELSEEEKLKKRIEELEDKLLRTAADFDNYKKRIARQFDEIVRFANDKIMVELLEVVDNFERALQYTNDDNDNTDFEALRKGTELIYNQMASLLGKFDVTPIEAVGQPFDPNWHEALMQIDSDEYPEGVIALEMSKGYKRGDRVIRHSKVGVSKGKPKLGKQDKNE